MKSSSQAVTFLMVNLMLCLLLAPASVGAIMCIDVYIDLLPCLIYLTSGSGMPPPLCCAGAATLAKAAATTADKRTACNCIKNAAKFLQVKPELAEALPKNCGFSVPIDISPDADCSKIS